MQIPNILNNILTRWVMRYFYVQVRRHDWYNYRYAKTIGSIFAFLPFKIIPTFANFLFKIFLVLWTSDYNGSRHKKLPEHS